MRSDFVILIPSHGRPTTVTTVRLLLRSGYTGEWRIIVDDEDATADEYERAFPGKVIVFKKRDADSRTDTYDNILGQRQSIVWALNMLWDIARDAGFAYFAEFDDDYTNVRYYPHDKTSMHTVKVTQTLDGMLEAMIGLVEATPILTVAMMQGGDFMGGRNPMRKAMNTFIFAVDRPFAFRGRFNSDINTYVGMGSTGSLFFTTTWGRMQQAETQVLAGGMGDLYKAVGTYVKSFYTVMQSPSCVKIAPMGMYDHRLHTSITWNHAVPMLLRESVRRSRASP